MEISQDTKIFKVTLMNDSTLVDGYGFIHTWLKFEVDNETPTYFSFGPETNIIQSEGKFDDDHAMEGRPATSEYRVTINEKTYNEMMLEIKKMKEEKIRYKLFPDKNKNYNCTTASLRVLNAGGVGSKFKNITTPFGIEEKISEFQGIAPPSNIFKETFQNLIQLAKPRKQIVDDVMDWYYEVNEDGNSKFLYAPALEEFSDKYRNTLYDIVDSCFGSKNVWKAYEYAIRNIPSSDIMNELTKGITHLLLKKLSPDTFIFDPLCKYFYIENPNNLGDPKCEYYYPVKHIRINKINNICPVIKTTKHPHSLLIDVIYPDNNIPKEEWIEGSIGIYTGYSYDENESISYDENESISYYENESIDHRIQGIDIYESIYSLKLFKTISISSLLDMAMRGTEEDDFIQGWKSRNNTIYGLGGNDVLEGGNYNDTLIGGAGDDFLVGGAGNDSYIFNLGDGNDTIFDSNGEMDTIKFGKGIIPKDILVKKMDNDLLLIINDKDSITVIDYFYDNEFMIEKIIFNNGTIWTPQNILSKLETIEYIS